MRRQRDKQQDELEGKGTEGAVRGQAGKAAGVEGRGRGDKVPER